MYLLLKAEGWLLKSTQCLLVLKKQTSKKQTPWRAENSWVHFALFSPPKRTQRQMHLLVRSLGWRGGWAVWVNWNCLCLFSAVFSSFEPPKRCPGFQRCHKFALIQSWLFSWCFYEGHKHQDPHLHGDITFLRFQNSEDKNKSNKYSAKNFMSKGKKVIEYPVSTCHFRVYQLLHKPQDTSLCKVNFLGMR